jgi:hypothetical protein
MSDLLTEAELALMGQDEEAEIVIEPEIEEKAPEEKPEPEIPAPTQLAGEANEEPPIVEPTPEIEPVVELEPLEATGRYAEVTMTETVPAALEEKLSSLAKQFDESEIDITEFLKQRAIIDRQITTFQIEEANSQKAYNSWMDAQDNFLNANRHYSNPVLYGALDTAVKEINADPRSRGMSPAEIMAAADYLVKDSFGQKPASEQTQTQAPAVKPTNTLPSVPTLTNIPASSMNDTGNDPFSVIERLTGDAKEAAVERLTPEQYAAYLKS